MRQFRVTHVASGIVTLVNACGDPRSGWVRTKAAMQAGLRFPADCTVRVVPVGQEVPLPFDEVPLQVRSRP